MTAEEIMEAVPSVSVVDATVLAALFDAKFKAARQRGESKALALMQGEIDGMQDRIDHLSKRLLEG